ncbi:endochitinase 2-like [Girardinichthys multiradiatus]|uniref:endochitinase 2-like n=1 Tax=Girardinichthys multiradiatus TaxID=208333 RepID=UPI001FADB91B|nr:endochitinase 2-like [Girardinichthys multiradiatus]
MLVWSVQDIHCFIMAVQLLFFILFKSLYETKAEALPQPNLMVDRLMITETDSVTLNCSTSPDVSVSRCDFYIANKKMSADSSCVETVTGTKLLSMAKIRSPAEVKVKCFYSVKDGAVDITSSDSISTTITINNLSPPTLTANPLVITESDSVTLNCQPPSSVPVTECFFHIGGGETPQRFPCLKTMRGTEILSLTKQSSPANFDVTCFYLKVYESPQSNLLNIMIELPPAELRVNPQQITESDSVTLNCGTPSFDSVATCSLYFIKSKIARSISCVQNMTGRELLMMTHQTSPAEVELTCYYTVKNTGGQHLSPDSHISSVTVHNVEKIDSTTSQRVSTFSVTAGQTFSTTAMKTDSLSSISPGSVKPTVGGTTVPQTNAENFSQTIPAFPATTVMMIWRFIAVGITSLFLLRLTLYFCKHRTVEQVWMSSLNNREMAGCDEPTLLQH